MADVKFILDAEHAKAVNAFLKVVDAQDKSEKGFKRQVNEGMKFDKMLGRIATGAIGAVAGIASITTAVRALGAEWRQVVDLQNRAAQSQVSVASAEQMLIGNLIGEDPAVGRQFVKDVGSIASRTGVPRVSMYQAAAGVVSASGGDLPLALSGLEQAARFMPQTPEAIQEFAGAMIDMSKATGSRDPRVNQGMLQAMGKMSRLETLRQQALNIPMAVIGQVNMGATARGAGAFFSALSVSMGDRRGEMSRTASIRTAEQVEEFFRTDPQAIAAARGAGLSPAMMTQHEKLMLMQGTSLAHRFYFGGPGRNPFVSEAAAKGPLRSFLLDPTGNMAQNYRAAYAGLPTLQAAPGFVDQAMAARAWASGEPAAAMQRSFVSSREDALTRFPALGLAGVLREGTIGTLRDTGMGKMAERIAALDFEVTTYAGMHDVAGTAERMLRTRASQLRHPEPSVSMNVGPGIGGPGRLRVREPSQMDLDRATILSELADDIARQTANLTEATENMKHGTQRLRNVHEER